MRFAADRMKALAIATAAAALVAAPANAATVEFRVTVPADTPADATLFVAGDLPALGSWKADGVPLRRDGATWVARVDVGDAPRAEFKITRGTWDRCEVALDGATRPNRVLALPVDHPNGTVVVDVGVERWREPPPPSRTGDMRTLPVAASADGSIPAREALVLLPAGYDAAATARYPVYYFSTARTSSTPRRASSASSGAPTRPRYSSRRTARCRRRSSWRSRTYPTACASIRSASPTPEASASSRGSSTR
ncbi:MAG: hypothetical protein JNM94_02170 [Phycisphaerae bacterium]|nr:hypothetical protein [Phycisphaerae bacterium]